MWCFPNRKLIAEIFKGVCWRTSGLQQGLTPVFLATCGCQLRKTYLDLSQQVMKQKLFSRPTSRSHRRKHHCQTPPHLAAELQASMEIVCVCERVCIHQVPILGDLAHHLLPCVRSCCRGEPSLGQCLCLYHFSVPETDGHHLLQRKRKPKQSQTRRLKGLLTKHHTEM